MTASTAHTAPSPNPDPHVDPHVPLLRRRHRPARALVARISRRCVDDRGAATAEYAIATMAAVGFASLLVVIMQSDEVRGILTDLVRTALTVGG